MIAPASLPPIATSHVWAELVHGPRDGERVPVERDALTKLPPSTVERNGVRYARRGARATACATDPGFTAWHYDHVRPSAVGA